MGRIGTMRSSLGWDLEAMEREVKEKQKEVGKKRRKRQLDGTVVHQPFGKKCGWGRVSIIVITAGREVPTTVDRDC